MPCAANAAWTWTMGPVFGGNLLDVRFASDATSGAPSIVVLGVATVAACLWATGQWPRART